MQLKLVNALIKRKTVEDVSRWVQENPYRRLNLRIMGKTVEDDRNLMHETTYRCL